MKLFLKYLRQHRLGLAAYFVFSAIFAFSFYLYALPLAAVLYPAALCLLLGVGVVITDFLRMRKRHLQLAGLANAGAELLSSLPEPVSVESADYQNIIAALRSECASLRSDYDGRVRDMNEYYTLWVHQIKTPIASMRLALRSEDSPRSRRLFSDLLRIEQYVEMVMVYLRLDADAGDYVFRECELDDIIKRSLRRFSSEFIDRRLSLSFEPSMLKIVTDEKWLGFVLDQLLSNALKYTQSGGIAVYLSEGHILCIKDSGIGMAPEDLPLVFQKGYTGCNGRTDMRASGIGLYLCGKVCKNLGIGISAESEVGSGTVLKLDMSQHRVA